jgi:hypothetical protein
MPVYTLPTNRSRSCRDDLIIGAELVEMTSYKSEQNLPTWLYINRSRPCRDDLIQIGADLFCCTPTSWLPARSPRTASIVSCATFLVSQLLRCQVAQPMFRFTIQILHQGFTRCRGPTNLCTRLLFADWRPLHCWSPEDTSDWSSADPYSRVSTALKKLITRLRDILQGRSTTDPCHHCIRFWSCNALLLAANQRYSLFTITLHNFCCSSRFYPLPVSHGGEWLILCYALLCRINLHTVFRYSYVCYFLVVWPLVSIGESD